MAGEKTNPHRYYPHPDDWVSGAVTIGEQSGSGGHSVELVAAQGTGVRTYLTHLLVSNLSGVEVNVAVKDGSTTKYNIGVPANSAISTPVMLKGTANTAWNVVPDAEADTIYVSACGFIAKE